MVCDQAKLRASWPAVKSWAVFVVLVAFTVVRGKELDVRIETDKSAYLQGEDIFLLLHRTNVSAETISVLYPHEVKAIVEVILTDDKGKPMPFTGPFINLDFERIRRFSLQPGETRTDQLRVLDLYGKNLPGGSISRHIPPGDYRLKVVYHHNYRVPYTSNEVSFTIKAPEGMEKEAYEHWTSTDAAYWRGKFGYAVQKYREFFERFPFSIYGPRVCRLAMISDDAHSRDWAEMMLGDYPESGNVDAAITVLIGNAVGERREVLLRDLAEKYKGTRSGELALKRIEMWREIEQGEKK